MQRLMSLHGVAAVAALGLLSFGLLCGAEHDALPMSTRSEVLLPPDSDALAWRYDMKMGSFTGGCAGLVYELNTPELIERRVKEMQREGLNTIIVNGLHMHHCFLDRWPLVTRFVAKLAETAHSQGMKVIFHHDVPVLLYNGTGLQHMLEHADWLARDIRHDRPTLRCYCIINPEFRRSYFERMTNLVRDTNIDGVMLDEASFAGKDFCGCEHCRRAFTAHTGFVLPREDTSDVFHNRSDPTWIAWLQWRQRAVGDWWVAMRKTFTTVKRDLCIMLYTTHYGFSNYWASRSFGSDLFEAARGCDFLGTEIMARNVYDAYHAVYAFRKAKSALGDHFGIPIWGLVYHVDDPVFAYFGWAMNHMNRQASWMSMIEGHDMSRFLDWPERMQNRFATPSSDVAIVFSSAARDFARMCSSTADPLGVAQCLTDAHVQYDFIIQHDLLDAKKLRRYRLLVLASIGVMTPEQAQGIREYVRDGGALLATANASLQDGSGFLRENFQLADVFGVNLKNASMLKGPRQIQFRKDGSTLEVPNAVVRVQARPPAVVLADVVINAKPYSPAIVMNDHGKGRCVYVANPLGAVNYEVEWGAGREMTFEKNRLLADLLLQLVRQTATGRLSTEPVHVPEKVILNVCRQTLNGRESLLLHLLNATGAGVKHGETVPLNKDWERHGPAFPALTEDIVIDLWIGTDPQLPGGYIVSPDYEGRRQVEIEPRPDGYVRLTVGKQDLQAYAIVVLPLGPNPDSG